jgi:hypothetical protein
VGRFARSVAGTAVRVTETAVAIAVTVTTTMAGIVARVERTEAILAAKADTMVSRASLERAVPSRFT